MSWKAILWDYQLLPRVAEALTASLVLGGCLLIAVCLILRRFK